jgi:aminoglycoside phosphotransferase (APT) family kinase protein
VVFSGGVNEVERVHDTVRRPTGPWTPAVHALLRHLAAGGFTGAPRVHGVDARGREILDFIPGEVTEEVDPGDDTALLAVARLVRAYHDATVGFVPPPAAAWQLPPREPAEVICHGDIAPYNCVFRDGRPVALIDFDTAHPAPRVWDVAYAAYRFVPLTATGPPRATQARRLGLFCAAYGPYGPGAADGALVVATAVERLVALAEHIQERAAAGDAAFARHLADGHVDLYKRDIAHLRTLRPPP